MYKIPANTLFIGKNLVFVPECHSTNTLALEMLENPTAVADGTTVITNKQTAGRGQRGSTWTSGENENITLSVIVKPSFLQVKDQFFLSIVTALAISRLVQQLVGAKSFIKWPNDIIVNDKKVCGILIENQVQGPRVSTSVIGIGMNVNQTSAGFPRAASLKQIAARSFDLEQTIHELLAVFEAEYLLLKAGRYADLRQRYLESMYKRNLLSRFSANGHSFQGIIEGIDDFGRLIVTVNGEKRIFDLKEISMQFEQQEQL